MTEAEWLTGDDVTAMLRHVRRTAGARKLRLFAVGCWRRHYQTARRFVQSIAALNAAEELADGKRGIPKGGWLVLMDGAYYVASRTSSGLAWMRGNRNRQVSLSVQAELLRCVIGNPFHPVTVKPTCLTAQVTALARAAYDERDARSKLIDPARLGVLADALEEAGCTSAAVLAHLRTPGPHVRGCWALDVVLGKS